jgi:hypothetical protein
MGHVYHINEALAYSITGRRKLNGVKSKLMDSGISTVEEKSSVVVGRPVGIDTSYEAQQQRVMMVADLLEKGTRSTKALQDAMIALGVEASRPTIIKYRNAALEMIAEETKPMNRDHLRNLEIGRLNYWIEQLTGKINALDWSVLDKDGQPVAFYMYDKMLQRLKDMGEQLHKITGLNTEVNVSIEEKRRIVFIRPQGASDVKDSGASLHNSNNDNVIDGVVTSPQ